MVPTAGGTSYLSCSPVSCPRQRQGGRTLSMTIYPGAWIAVQRHFPMPGFDSPRLHWECLLAFFSPGTHSCVERRGKGRETQLGRKWEAAPCWYYLSRQPSAARTHPSLPVPHSSRSANDSLKPTPFSPRTTLEGLDANTTKHLLQLWTGLKHSRADNLLTILTGCPP